MVLGVTENAEWWFCRGGEGRTTDGFALVVRIFRVARVFRAF